MSSSDTFIMNKKMVHMITFILLIVGGLNWLLTAFDMNLVTMILGNGAAAKVVYILVGLSALYELFTHKKSCTMCGASQQTTSM